MNLLDLSLNYRTDKGTLHSYLEVYSYLFRGFRNINLLEIGTFRGESLLLWSEYFPNSQIYGIDIVQYVSINTDKIHTIIGDSTKPEILNHFSIKFDIIIDDGSHILKDQLSTLKNFYPLLNPGGLYIVEDIFNLEKVKHHFTKFNKCTIIDRRSITNEGTDVLIIYIK